jgi:hypothetical protein
VKSPDRMGLRFVRCGRPGRSVPSSGNCGTMVQTKSLSEGPMETADSSRRRQTNVTGALQNALGSAGGRAEPFACELNLH